MYPASFVSPNCSLKTGDKIVYSKPLVTFGNLRKIEMVVVTKVLPGTWSLFLLTGDTLLSTHTVKKSVRGYPDVPPIK